MSPHHEFLICFNAQVRFGKTFYWIIAFSVSAKMYFQAHDILATVLQILTTVSIRVDSSMDSVFFDHFLVLAVVRKWYYPQHIVASTLLKPKFWGTFFLIPPVVYTNRISILPKPRCWSTHVQDPWHILTNQMFESIVSLLGCRSATTVLQISTFRIVSSSSWQCLVIVWVLIRAHSSTDADIRRCELLVLVMFRDRIGADLSEQLYRFAHLEFLCVCAGSEADIHSPA